MNKRMFARRHYVSIANIFKEELSHGAKEREYFVVITIIARMMSLFEEDNPSFDKQRFINACGIKHVGLFGKVE